MMFEALTCSRREDGPMHIEKCHVEHGYVHEYAAQGHSVTVIKSYIIQYPSSYALSPWTIVLLILASVITTSL